MPKRQEIIIRHVLPVSINENIGKQTVWTICGIALTRKTFGSDVGYFVDDNGKFIAVCRIGVKRKINCKGCIKKVKAARRRRKRRKRKRR